MRIFIICFSLLISPVYGVEVDLFPSGQGNTIVAHHKGEVIIVDAGSSEMAYAAALRKKANVEMQELDLEVSQPEAAHAGAGKKRDQEPGHEGDSTESPSGSGASGPPSGDDNTDQPPRSSRFSRPSSERRQQERTDNYARDLIAEIREHIRLKTASEEEDEERAEAEPDGEAILRVKAFIATHGDKDHYMLLPGIFPYTGPRFRIESVVLGGFHREYSGRFLKWLGEARTRGAIGEVIFTGMADGGEGSGSLNPREAGYARPYCSAMEGKGPTEVRIERALTFTNPLGEEGEAPKLEILSMNAGHAVDIPASGGAPLIRRANPHKNANSMVLCLRGLEHSILLTGDAEGPTWEHVFLHHLPASLQTDYFVVSHHGSKEEGATSPELLDSIQPTACFLSVGRHRGYHHPAEETLDVLLSSGSLYETAAPHSVSYYAEDPTSRKRFHKRKWTRKAVFSTLNSGRLSVDLDSDRPAVKVSQRREKVYTEAASGEGGARRGGLRKFRVNYNEAYYLEADESMGEAIDEIVGNLRKEGTNVTLWEKVYISKAGKGGNVVSPSGAIKPCETQPPREITFSTEYHILIDEMAKRPPTTKRGDRRDRLYFLDLALEEEELDPAAAAAAAVQNRGGASPAGKKEAATEKEAGLDEGEGEGSSS